MVQGAFHQRFRVGFAVFLQQMLFQRPGVDADAHGAAVIASGLDDLFDPFVAADIARIDAQAGRTTGGGFQGTTVVEVNVGDDRHLDLLDDVLQRQGAFLVGAGDTNDIDARRLGEPDLRHRPGDIRCEGVGHGLHRDRRAVAHWYLADIDPAGLAPDDFLIRAVAAHRGLLNRGACVTARILERDD